ncbi:MAG TPA: lipid II flippase MurJ, partial [Acidimicrobiales bacterium]|nr:lipid II flippase MurJ [Acidimicrobiales bacterium]
FFLPQLVLYAFGFLAIDLLNAKRVFALPAAAPIGSTVVIVVSMVVFAAMAGTDPGLELTRAEIVVLGLGGTLGVAAFVGIPMIDLHRRGFRLRPRLPRRDPAVGRLLRLSSWAVLQHTGAALLLGAAIILGGAVEGGVVAYRVAFYVFLAPYGVLAQPVHTTVTPELATDVANGDLPSYAKAVRWGLDALSVTILPVSAALFALSVPMMAVIAFGEADSDRGIELMAAATASLALGLFAYGAFRLLAGAYYALEDSRTPAIVAVASAVVGVAFMLVASAMSEGTSTIFLLGIGHTVAFLLGALVLGIVLRRRIHQPLFPRAFAPALVVSALLAGVAWAVVRALDPSTRLEDLAVLAGVGLAGLALWWLAVRALRLAPEKLTIHTPAAAA